MASQRHVTLTLLISLTSQLVRCGILQNQLTLCQKTVWSPGFLYSPSSLPFPWSNQDSDFATEKECQAAMCVPKCKDVSFPAFPPRSPVIIPQPAGEGKTTKATHLDKPGDRPNLPTIPMNSGIKQLTELQAVLGPNSKLIQDKDGQVIGVEAPENVKSPDTESRPSSQSGKFPGDDASICCSTVEVFYFNQTLVDYYGRTQVIAQINEVGVYQFIRHGVCGSTGACTGQCDQIYITVPLIVHPTQAGQQVSFSMFKIPGYCTCRVRSGSFRSL
ncbi:hypothetical protein EGW08_012002 [Elysia chlorotica]|uniref:Spaetzle domain-containing protein n=1 Tax=Elysia chlorotica TaxID=188477 RepID=A0A433TF86_ELYCH|nr:hypothetical protein EGW08_012002 [Elysia chlorotica]